MKAAKRLFVIYAVVLNAICIPLRRLIRSIQLLISSISAAVTSGTKERVQQFEEFYPEQDTKFLLYTRQNTQIPLEITLDEVDKLKISNFNPAHPIRILVHGFRDGPGANVNREGRNALFQKGNYNVIVVDWSIGANTLDYILARERVSEVGKVVAKFIDHIIRDFEVSLANVGLIGHSLGAHVVGLAGKNTQTGKVGFIVGLDPAGPLFFLSQPESRLDKDDAVYVQIIHTDAGVQGFESPIGHADFYPNNGRKQPGCGLDLTGACSHQRSVYYWSESINSNVGFWASPCTFDEVKEKGCTEGGSGQVLMGGDPMKSSIYGIYYLKTALQSPFALGPSKDIKVIQKF